MSIRKTFIHVKEYSRKDFQQDAEKPQFTINPAKAGNHERKSAFLLPQEAVRIFRLLR
jgi:hypothetical protein